MLFKHYKDDDRISALIDKMQINGQCCGWNGRYDFGRDPLPESCCKRYSASCTPEGEYHKEGCKNMFLKNKKYISIISYTVVVMSFIPLVFAFVSFFVAYKFKNRCQMGVSQPV